MTETEVTETRVAPPRAGAEPPERGWRGASRVASAVCFWGALALLPLTAVPYGAVEPWWKAAFQCLAFLLTAVWLCDVAFFGGGGRLKGARLLLPFAALVLYAFLQSVSWGSTTVPFILPPVGRTISADPAATRGFALQLAALVLTGWLLFRYARSGGRLRLLCHAVIFVALASAAFGLCRHSMQGEDDGFLLAGLRHGVGFGQFVNRNHFPFLMEAAMGLAAGLLLTPRLSVGARLTYLGAYAFMGAAVVFSNSKGGILSVVCQLLLVGAFFDAARRGRHAGGAAPGRRSRARRSLVRAALVLGLLSAVTLGVIWVGGDRLASRVDEAVGAGVDESRSNASRRDIWRATLRLIAEHPVAGAGFGGYWVAVSRYNDASGRVAPQEAHNDYLELVASGGLIGVTLAAWAAFALARQARRCLRESHGRRRALCFGALAGLFAVGLHSLVDFGLHITVNAVAFAALIVLATREVPGPNPPGRRPHRGADTPAL